MADKIRIDSNFDIQENYELSDSENEYTSKEKQLLENIRKRKRQDSNSEDEVYAFSESDEGSDKQLDIADSDVEGQEQSEDDIPDSKAWGKKKRSYYSTDYVDEDYGGFGDEEQDAIMEEEEARNIQKRLIEQLEEKDFALDFLNTKTVEDDEKEVVIKTDVSQMSKRQKLQLLEKESPEFAGLIDDFKSKLTVAKDDLHPVLELVKGGKLPNCPASKFVKTNYDLIVNYCTNISFYLLLKSQRISIQNHPVTKRLYQYRQMLKKMEPIYVEVIKPQVDKILHAIKNNLKLEIVRENNQVQKYKLQKKSEKSNKKFKYMDSVQKDGDDTGVSDNNDDGEECDDEGLGNDFFNTKINNEKLVTNESEESGFSDNEDTDNNVSKPSTSREIMPDDVGDKREITYQIAKNKGLTPHRKKEQRNPRVKHKLKYRKAKIRRKGAVREPRTEVNRYGGESSGIKANVKKGIKIK